MLKCDCILEDRTYRTVENVAFAEVNVGVGPIILQWPMSCV